MFFYIEHSGVLLLPTLKFNIRADLFSQLGAMEQAGLSTKQALDLTQLPPSLKIRLVKMHSRIDLGFSISNAGLVSGLFTTFEAALIHVACNAGSPARTYRRLADYYTRRVQRIKKMKSRMMLPLAMLVIADFVGPLPKIFAGELGLGHYLMSCFLPLIAIGIAVYLFVELPRRLNTNLFLMLSLSAENILRRVPWFGSMTIRRNIRDFFDSLALLLEAGMPILDALPIATEVIQNKMVRWQFSQIKSRIEEGASFARAIGDLSFVGCAQAYALIQAGEFSGALPEALFRYSDLQTDTINQFDDQVAEWVPRVIYTMIALWMGYGLIHSGAFISSLP